MKQNIKKAKRHLTKLRELVSRRKPPLSEVKEEKVLETLRKTREELWDKKLVTENRHFLRQRDNLPFKVLTAADCLKVIKASQ